MATIKKPRVVPRNPVVRSPLLKKGGAHRDRSKASRCRPIRVRVDMQDWREELEFERSLVDRSDLTLLAIAA